MKDTPSVALVTPMRIYRLANGLNLFSETVEDAGGLIMPKGPHR